MPRPTREELAEARLAAGKKPRRRRNLTSSQRHWAEVKASTAVRIAGLRARMEKADEPGYSAERAASRLATYEQELEVAERRLVAIARGEHVPAGFVG